MINLSCQWFGRVGKSEIFPLGLLSSREGQNEGIQGPFFLRIWEFPNILWSKHSSGQTNTRYLEVFLQVFAIPRPRMACTIPLASFSFQQRSSSLLCHLAMVKSLINDTHILVKMGKLSDSRSFFSPTPRNWNCFAIYSTESANNSWKSGKCDVSSVTKQTGLTTPRAV